MRSITTVSSLVLIAACVGRARPVEPEVRYQDVPIAVTTGCVADRPDEIASIKAQVNAADWAARAPGAKAQAVRAQAGRRLNYEAALAAATSGCTAAATIR